jgi:hypothetical protein
MQYTRDKRFLMVSRITGPTHNLLQLDLQQVSLPSIESIPAIGPMPAQPLNAELVLRHVIAGVEAANKELGTSYRVGVVRFVADDSRPESVYEMLAFVLIKHLASGGHFAESPNNTVERDARKSSARPSP